jgi:hypothetical protein
VVTRAVLDTSVLIAGDMAHLDDAVAASFGRLAASLVAHGRRPRGRSLDLLIAATAHAHRARLSTRNGADLVGLVTLLESSRCKPKWKSLGRYRRFSGVALAY